MRIVRYVLQAIILLLGAATLAASAFAPRFDPWGFAGVAAFFAFLLLLTLWLRDVTESRLTPLRPENEKLIAIVLLCFGLASCWVSLTIVSGDIDATPRRRGLLSVAIELLGPWPPAACMLAAGFAMIVVAYRLARMR